MGKKKASEAKVDEKAVSINNEILTERATCTLDVYRKLVREANDLESLIVPVTTREGNVKPEVHPIVSAIGSTAETIRRQLSEMLVTPKSKKTKGGCGAPEEDALSKLVSNLGSLSDD